MSRRRSRVVGSRVVGVAAFLAVASAAAPAHADIDDMMDLLFTPFATTDGALDGQALFDATAWDSFLSTAHWDAAFAALAEPADPGLAVGFDFYTGLHDLAEKWIDSELGTQVNGAINTLLGSTVIGNGAEINTWVQRINAMDRARRKFTRDRKIPTAEELGIPRALLPATAANNGTGARTGRK